jgi:hypothetical protein
MATGKLIVKLSKWRPNQKSMFVFENSFPYMVPFHHSKHGGHKMQYRSKFNLFGLPFIHIATSEIENDRVKRGIARGWIAIADISFGILFSAGGVAVEGIAVGGLAAGGTALAGLSLGIFAFGGGALGVWACGGIALA